MMTEIWKPVPGYEGLYEGLYEVSNIGEIRSIPRHGTFKNLHILKGGHNKDGYKQISLTKNGKPKTFKVHRIVASVFIPNPMGYREINHKDENKDNNSVENLEWVTRSENIRHAYRTGLLKVKTTPVLIVETGEIFESVTECARRIGCDHSSISHCLAGRSRTCRGYHLEYA